MVPVWVPAKVPEVAEVKLTEALTVPDPEAYAKRPVPPVITNEPVS